MTVECACAENVMEVECTDSISGSLHQDCKTTPHTSSYNQVSNFVDEYIDQKRRKNNVIIYNLSENNPDHPEQALNDTDSSQIWLVTALVWME